jgi:hypothetical protein
MKTPSWSGNNFTRDSGKLTSLVYGRISGGKSFPFPPGMGGLRGGINLVTVGMLHDFHFARDAPARCRSISNPSD